MSKVEELREKVEVAIFHVEDNESMYLAIGMLDSLIAAARAEGAEGQYQKDRERLFALPKLLGIAVSANCEEEGIVEPKVIKGITDQLLRVFEAMFPSVLSPAPTEPEVKA